MRNPVVTTLAVVPLLLAAGAADARRPERCRAVPHGAEALKRTRTVLVYQRGDTVYACLRPDGRRYALGEDDGLYNTVTIDRVTRTAVTYTDDHTPECKADCPPGVTGTTTTATIDLRTGRRATAAAPSAARRAARRRCRLPRGARLLARTSKVLVYSDKDLDEAGYGSAFMCGRPAGHRRMLLPIPDEDVEFSAVRGIRTAGAFVAYEFTQFVGGAMPPASTQLALIGPRGCCGPDVQIQIGADADALTYLPTAGGQLVYLLGNADPPELRVAGRGFGGLGETETGPGRLVDTGAIDPASVQVAGTTLSWTNGGTPKILPLGG